QNFNQRGSNWIVSRMLNFSVMTAAYSPLAGSSYIKTPKFLVDKKCCTNINNITDEFCFLWCILGVIHPVTRNPSELYNYRRYLNELNVSGLVFPMPVRSIERFERLNPSVSVNVFYFDEDDKEIVPLYVTKHTGRQHHANLLLLSDGTKRHYILIRSISRLVAHRTKRNGKTYVCVYCLRPYKSRDAYDRHLAACMTHTPTATKYQEEGSKEAILQWRSKEKTERLDFVIFCDFETILVPHTGTESNTAKTEIVNDHEVCGVAMYTVSKYPEFQTDIF